MVHTIVTDLRGPDHQLRLAGLPIRQVIPLSVATGEHPGCLRGRLVRRSADHHPGRGSRRRSRPGDSQARPRRPTRCPRHPGGELEVIAALIVAKDDPRSRRSTRARDRRRVAASSNEVAKGVGVISAERAVVACCRWAVVAPRGPSSTRLERDVHRGRDACRSPQRLNGRGGAVDTNDDPPGVCRRGCCGSGLRHERWLASGGSSDQGRKSEPWSKNRYGLTLVGTERLGRGAWEAGGPYSQQAVVPLP